MMQVKQAQKPDEQVITVKQEALIELLLSGIALAAAAKQLGVNESTCRRWLKLPHVRIAYRAARQEAFDERLGMLRDGVNVALKTLMSCMDPAKTKSEFVRMGAASKWLELSIQIYTANELDSRVEKIEQLIKERLNGKL